jgi:hypothetical protein
MASQGRDPKLGFGGKLQAERGSERRPACSEHAGIAAHKRQ